MSSTLSYDGLHPIGESELELVSLVVFSQGLLDISMLEEFIAYDVGDILQDIRKLAHGRRFDEILYDSQITHI